MTNNPVADLVADTPKWHCFENEYSILLYTLKQDGWRRGEPVMVNDLTIRIENANGSTDDLGPIADKLLAALTPASADPVAVAYQVAMSDGRWGTIFHHPDKPLGDHRPLYAHPPSPMSVEAAAKVLLDWWSAESVASLDARKIVAVCRALNASEDDYERFLGALRALSGEES